MEWLIETQKWLKRDLPVALVTVVGTKGSSPRALGAKMLVASNGRVWGTIGGGQLEQLATEDAIRTLKEGVTQRFEYPLSAKAGQCCGGFVELLIEPLNSAPKLYIFGAGHVGSALAGQFASGSRFQVHLIDSRREWIGAPGLPESTIKHECDPVQFAATLDWHPPRSWAVVLTHDHELDFSLMLELAPRGLKYLGLIGSQTKWRRFSHRLKESGITDAQLAPIRCPVGLEIAAESPQEISVSIAAELIQLSKVHAGEATQAWNSAADDPCEKNP